MGCERTGVYVRLRGAKGLEERILRSVARNTRVALLVNWTFSFSSINSLPMRARARALTFFSSKEIEELEPLIVFFHFSSNQFLRFMIWVIFGRDINGNPAPGFTCPLLQFKVQFFDDAYQVSKYLVIIHFNYFQSDSRTRSLDKKNISENSRS